METKKTQHYGFPLLLGFLFLFVLFSIDNASVIHAYVWAMIVMLTLVWLSSFCLYLHKRGY